MRKCFVLMAVGALLCATVYAQTTADGQANNSQQSEVLPADAQTVNAPKPPQPSLGDYARQLRLKKQQREAQLHQAKENAKENGNEKEEKQTPAPETQSADVKPAQQTQEVTPGPHAAAAPPVQQTPDVTPKPQAKPQVVTTAEIPGRATVTPASVRQTVTPAPQSQEIPSEAQVRQWKKEIQQQKSLVASLQQDIANLKNSIHFAGGNCIANCDQWNDRQKQKKQDLETLQAQLQQQQGILAEMLEAERVLMAPTAPSSQQPPSR